MAGEQRTDLRIELRAGLELRGRVDRQAHGLAEVGSLTLRLRRREELDGAVMLIMVAKTTVRPDGSFVFTGLAGGTYAIAIEAATGARYVHDGSIELGTVNIEDLELCPVAQE